MVLTRRSAGATHIGVIAEDESDVKVFESLTAKLIKDHLFSVKWFKGGGSGKLRRKCGAWAQNLFAKKCKIVVVIHDLDQNDEDDLRNKITKQLGSGAPGKHLILIPIQEIESWLLADRDAVKSTFSIRNLPKIPADTESIQNPKEFLRDIVTRNSKTRYVNTVHNKVLASAVSVNVVMKKCPSFRPYPEFLKVAFPNRQDWVVHFD